MRQELFDLIMVPLLTFFFAALQKGRPQRRYRLWLAGWLLELTSMAIREWEQISRTSTPALETARIWAIVFAGIAFLLSFGQKDLTLRQLCSFGLMLSLPACLGILLVNTGTPDKWMIVVLIVGGEVLADWALRRSYGLQSKTRLLVLDILAVVSGAAMLWLVATNQMRVMYAVVLAEIFIACGLMFLTLPSRNLAGQWIASQGFFFWALQYPLYWWMGDRPGWESSFTTLISLWYLPKYLVAFGMILRVMEEDQERVRTLTEEYRLLYEGNPHPMLVFSPEDGRFLSANEAALRAYGYAMEEFLELSVPEIFPPEDAATRAEMLRYERRFERYQTLTRRKDGSSFHAEMTMYPVTFQSQWARFLLVVDTTEHVELNRELVRQAQHDHLTGLPNRTLLEDRLSQWLSIAQRSDKPAALMTLDLDRFKLINDTYGHLVGDECLKQAAARMQSRIRQSDTLARTGGEEFTLIVHHISSEDGARSLAESLLRLFDRPLHINGLIIPITISIGVAIYPADAHDLDTLRQLSDDALYQAKRTGRNRVVFAGHMPVRDVQRLTSD
ncbi:sensor domain-containing diguanylate cyclase [Terriglobus albidus]|uniref:sensor domain-containing diguanylate cyclase n=1 Tax=Terriglobus albidus TaxID=1592106 RepID=UPI0021DFE77F|nr:sensor domain-containing diguanylate cyclase [Terriglobus albidus]